jgi:hypothetical protein
MNLPYVIGKRIGLCYVRVRCPCCGMWTRLDNLKRDQPLFEESTTYSGGRDSNGKGILIHDKKTNPSLKAFWIIHLKRVLERLGFEIPYEIEIELPYQRPDIAMPIYSVEKEMSYGYER